MTNKSLKLRSKRKIGGAFILRRLGILSKSEAERTLSQAKKAAKDKKKAEKDKRKAEKDKRKAAKDAAKKTKKTTSRFSNLGPPGPTPPKKSKKRPKSQERKPEEPLQMPEGWEWGPRWGHIQKIGSPVPDHYEWNGVKWVQPQWELNRIKRISARTKVRNKKSAKKEALRQERSRTRRDNLYARIQNNKKKWKPGDYAELMAFVDLGSTILSGTSTAGVAAPHRAFVRRP